MDSLRIAPLVLAVLAAGLHAQAQPPAKEKPAKPKKEHHEMAPTGWKALDAYHEILRDTWHPAKEKQDLAPIRAKAGDLAKAATALAASTPLAACSAPKLTSIVAVLPSKTQAVADLVAKNADDATLMAAFKALHRQFEPLEKGCAKRVAKGKA